MLPVCLSFWQCIRIAQCLKIRHAKSYTPCLSGAGASPYGQNLTVYHFARIRIVHFLQGEAGAARGGHLSRQIAPLWAESYTV